MGMKMCCILQDGINITLNRNTGRTSYLPAEGIEQRHESLHRGGQHCEMLRNKDHPPLQQQRKKYRRDVLWINEIQHVFEVDLIERFS